MKFPFGNMWVSTRLSPVFDKEYQVVSVLGLSIDITERKQVEDALRKGEVELNEAQHLGQIGSWDFDAAMGSITRSKEYYRVYGLDPKINRNDFQEHLKVVTVYFRIKTINAIIFFRPSNTAHRCIKVPTADLSEVLCFIKFYLTLAECIFHLFTLGDVN